MREPSSEAQSCVDVTQLMFEDPRRGSSWSRRPSGRRSYAASGAHSWAVLVAWSACLCLSPPVYADQETASGDGFIKSAGARWLLGTASVEKVVALEDGRFLLRSFKSKATGQEMLEGSAPSDEFFALLGDKAERVGGVPGNWRLVESRTLPGDLVYLNLPRHPGSKLDARPPTPPTHLTKRQAQNMGYPGVELAWNPGKDDNWISYYEISRNGMFLDKLAKGTFYFDHSAGADLAATYEVRSVDCARNVSRKVPVRGPAAPPARVFDDAPGGAIRFSGDWQRQTDIPPAHAGTLTRKIIYEQAKKRSKSKGSHSWLRQHRDRPDV